MFDQLLIGEQGPSLFEEALAAVVAGQVTVRPAPPSPIEIDLDGWHGPRLPVLDRLLATGSAALDQAVAAAREASRLAATEARALAAFARARPQALFDRQPGEPGAMSETAREARPTAIAAVSEWAVDEVAVALRISPAAADGRLIDAVVLVERLPATLAALEEGRISWAHARQIIAIVGPIDDDELRARIEARGLGLVKNKTPSQLGDCARRIVLREDADAAARKLVAAVRERGVRFHDRRDGTATVALDLPLPVAASIYRTLEAHAEQLRAEGDERSKQQRMADAVADLILRAGENGLPAVTISLTLVAALETLLGGGEPGLVDGHLVSAEAVRELAYTFGLVPRPAPQLDDLPDRAPHHDEVGADHPQPPDDPPTEDPAPDDPPTEDVASGGPAPPQGSSPPVTPVRDRPLAEWVALAAARHEAAVDAALGGARQALLDGVWTDGEDRALLDVGALMGVRTIAGTGLAHRPHIAVVDMLRGSLVALTDATAIRRGEALGPPGPTHAHDPTVGLARFVRLRDRRCRFPGCRARARVCDLDHQKPWPAGRTEHTNLCCMCEHHHRLKHQAPGWRFEQASEAQAAAGDADESRGPGEPDGPDSPDARVAPGDLVVTTPSGETIVSRPPRFGTDLELDPPPF